MVEIARSDEISSSDVVDYFTQVIAPQVLSRQVNKVQSEGTLFDYLQQICTSLPKNRMYRVKCHVMDVDLHNCMSLHSYFGV